MKKTFFDYQKTLLNYIEFLKLLKIYKKKMKYFMKIILKNLIIGKILIFKII